MQVVASYRLSSVEPQVVGNEPDGATLTRVLDFVRGLQAGHSDIDADTELLTTGYLSSLGIVSLMAFIEQEFGVEITESEFTVAAFSTARAVADLIARGTRITDT